MSEDTESQLSLLMEIASNTGSTDTAEKSQHELLSEIAENTKDGGGGGGTPGPAYDDTAIKQRVSDVETKNTAQDETLTTHGQTLTELTSAIQTANQKNAAQDLILTALTRYDSQMIVPWGDSRSAQNWNTNTTPAAPLARSWLYWAELLSQRVRMDVTYMQGVSGDKMSDLLLRIQNDTVPTGGFGTKKPSEVPPCIAALMCWTNSINAGVPLAQLLIETNLVLDYLLSKGHKVILIAEWPRAAGSALTADNKKLMLATHNALLKIRRKNVWIVDVWPRVADPSSVDGYPYANMLNPDDLHNSPGIAFITGQEIARVLRDELALPRLKMTTASNGDQYDAVLQPQGCLNTNPMLITPGGTVGSNASGAVPLGYTLSTTNAGMSAVGSYVDVVLPDGSKRKAYRIVVSGTPTAANAQVRLRMSGLIGKVTAGDILESNYEVNVTDGHANFGAPGIVIDGAANTAIAHGGLGLTGDNIMPPQAVGPFYGVPRSADLNCAVLPASLSFELRLWFTLANVAASLTIDILSTSLRKKKQ